MNSMFLFIICICAWSIFIKMYWSHKNVSGMASSHPQYVVGKVGTRLMLLLFFNFVCWIPILTIACIMLAGGNIHDNVLIWVAIFILPISATTDPFLYNINVFRRRSLRK